ncbi:hypothetical protein OROGR_022394 [Orobanche gracilis]
MEAVVSQYAVSSKWWLGLGRQRGVVESKKYCTMRRDVENIVVPAVPSVGIACLGIRALCSELDIIYTTIASSFLDMLGCKGLLATSSSGMINFTGDDYLLLNAKSSDDVDTFARDDFMNFMFMASPEYIPNPYFRSKMVEVLICWMLGEGHQLSLEYLVKNLLKLYVDIEFTGSHTPDSMTFNIPHNIAKLLYLCQVPSHRNVWRKIAKDDDILNKILELKELEAEMSNTVEWGSRPAQERQERTRLFQSHENMSLYQVFLKGICFHVERVVSMLIYFLLQLVGPQTKSLSLKDLEKYEFRPKQIMDG